MVKYYKRGGVMCEIYPNPTVKQVIFQIKFPNLLYIEKSIGDIQIKIMDDYPESAEMIQKTFLFGYYDEKISDQEENRPLTKIWKFTSPNGYELTISSNALSIVSRLHKTYKNQSGEHRFRDIIKSTVDSFLSVINIPKITRIGLRYTDECPLPKIMNFKNYAEYYNTAFTERFSFENARNIQYMIVKNVEDNILLRYMENYESSLEKDVVTNEENNVKKMVMDFDASSFNIASSEYIETLDKLYDVIHNEWENTIKEPVKEIMRKKTNE